MAFLEYNILITKGVLIMLRYIFTDQFIMIIIIDQFCFNCSD